jgi:hypothetical protein
MLFCEHVDFHVVPFKYELALEYENLSTLLLFDRGILYSNIISYIISYILYNIQFPIVHLWIVQCSEKWIS